MKLTLPLSVRTQLSTVANYAWRVQIYGKNLFHSQSFQNAILFAFGLSLLVLGSDSSGVAERTINYNDQRLVEAINAVLSYLEGSFGALVMVCSGVGAILSAAFGQYRASLGLLVVAIGSFILRSLIGTFFNDVSVQE